MFSKNIDCSDVINDKMFHFFTVKNRTITVGANIIVPEGYSAIFVCRDKITDVLPNGKFAITGANMPKTFKRMRLGKANKKGNFPKKFMADLYFICTNDVSNIRFASYNPYKSKSNKFGRIKAHSEGTFNMKIHEPEKLLKYMLLERAFVGDDLFLDLLGGMIGDYVNNALMNCDRPFYEIVSNSQYSYDLINGQLIADNPFDFAGFSISNVKIEFMKVDAKLQEKIEEEVKVQSSFLADVNKVLETQLEVPAPSINKEEIVSEVKIERNLQPAGDIGYKTCPGCRQKINRSARFCERCGMDLSNF